MGFIGATPVPPCWLAVSRSFFSLAIYPCVHYDEEGQSFVALRVRHTHPGADFRPGCALRVVHSTEVLSGELRTDNDFDVAEILRQTRLPTS